MIIFPNDTNVYFLDINNPSNLRGHQFHSSIIVGQSKYPQTKDMVKLGLRLGDSPTLFELNG